MKRKATITLTAPLICVHCGKQVAADRERFCNNYGLLFAGYEVGKQAQAGRTVTDQRLCANCGTPLDPPWWDKEKGGYVCHCCGMLNAGPEDPTAKASVGRTVATILPVLVLGYFAFAFVARPPVGSDWRRLSPGSTSADPR